jgi:hypothetical protein
VVVVSARGDERRLRTHALHQFKAEDAAIKVEGTLQVSDFQVNMPDAGVGMDRLRHAD